jgi:1,4-alpha-glucan branching enzyme
MIDKTLSPLPQHVRVVFELPAHLWADQVFVVGDFNGWDICATPLHQARDGRWRAVVDLPHGSQYQFRYLIDGRWLADAYADGFAIGLDGTENSIVEASLPAKELVLEQWTSQVWQEQTSDVLAPAAPTRMYSDDCNRHQNPARKIFTLTLWQTWQHRSRARG